MAAPEFLWLVQESAFGTPATPVTGTNAFYMRLPDSNSFTPVMDPVFQDTPYGGGWDVQADVSADHYEVKGSLSTLLYPAQAPMLLAWGLQRINTGQTTPWVTTEPAGDLPSVTAYHAIMTRSGTYRRRKITGGKVLGGEVSASRSSPRVMLKLDLQFKVEQGNSVDSSSDPDATAFPAPTEAQYATGPYLFSHSSTNMIFTSAVASYDSFSLKWTNKMDPRFWENHFLFSNGWHGRESTLDFEALFKTSPDYRADMIAMTARTVSLKLNNGTNFVKVDFATNNHVVKVPWNLGLGKEFTQNVSLKNKWDPAAAAGAGADILFTSG